MTSLPRAISSEHLIERLLVRIEAPSKVGGSAPSFSPRKRIAALEAKLRSKTEVLAWVDWRTQDRKLGKN